MFRWKYFFIDFLNLVYGYLNKKIVVTRLENLRKLCQTAVSVRITHNTLLNIIPATWINSPSIKIFAIISNFNRFSIFKAFRDHFGSGDSYFKNVCFFVPKASFLAPQTCPEEKSK